MRPVPSTNVGYEADSARLSVAEHGGRRSQIRPRLTRQRPHEELSKALIGAESKTTSCGGKQTAALGIAVTGGLLFSTFISLWLVPLVYDWLMGENSSASTSLDPNDETSVYYDNHV